MAWLTELKHDDVPRPTKAQRGCSAGATHGKSREVHCEFTENGCIFHDFHWFSTSESSFSTSTGKRSYLVRFPSWIYGVSPLHDWMTYGLWMYAPLTKRDAHPSIEVQETWIYGPHIQVHETNPISHSQHHELNSSIYHPETPQVHQVL